MKYFLFSFFFFVLMIVNIGFNMPIVRADDLVGTNNPKNESLQNTQFIPLVGIPYVNTNDQNMSLSGYVNALYIASMSIAAFMAVVKIIFAGVKYMLSDVITTKESAKKDIKGALLGLLIVIGAVLILNTINPELSKLTFLGGPPVDITLGEYGTENILSDICDINSGGCIFGDCTNGTWIKLVQNENGASCESACSKVSGQIIQNDFGNNLCVTNTSAYKEVLLNNALIDKCPTGQSCDIIQCNNDTFGILGSNECQQQCTDTGGQYDTVTSACIITTTSPISIDPTITYYKKQNEDEIAGGYPKQKITILGEVATNGLVRIRYEDGEEVEISCAYITPSPCNN